MYRYLTLILAACFLWAAPASAQTSSRTTGDTVTTGAFCSDVENARKLYDRVNGTDGGMAYVEVIEDPTVLCLDTRAFGNPPVSVVLGEYLWTLVLTNGMAFEFYVGDSTTSDRVWVVWVQLPGTGT